MRGNAIAAILLAGAVAAAQEGAPREYKVRPLDFSVVLPDGWTAEQDGTGMVARDAAQNGFIVSREPFLHDAAAFATAWRGQLAAAQKDVQVERAKAGSREAWRAAWTAGDRRIEIWRVYVPESEMLYNFSFSAAAGFDLKPLVEGVLKSFKCSPPKPEIKFHGATESVTTRVQIRLPEGYAKEAGFAGFPGLGGGLMGGVVKTLPGFEPPHVAGRIRFRGYDANTVYVTEDRREIQGGDAEKMLESSWKSDEDDFASVDKKPRGKDAVFGGIKGYAMEASVVGKDGLPRRWMGFCGKHKQDLIEVIILVDEREARLHKDMLRQVCGNLVVEK